MTGRPRRDVLDGSITDPDKARRELVTLARKLAAIPLGVMFPEGARLCALVLWMDTHLSSGGALPTQWAEDSTVPHRPVTTVHLPAP